MGWSKSGAITDVIHHCVVHRILLHLRSCNRHDKPGRVSLENQHLPFTVSTEGQNKLGLREVCERYANELWIADLMTPDQAAESVLDQFKRAAAAELELLSVDAGNTARREQNPMRSATHFNRHALHS